MSSQIESHRASELLTTVGVLTVGDAAFGLCIAALQAQTSKNFTIEIVRNQSPFNRAFQEMVNRVHTPYVIQVDEDMILYPQAVARMQEVMSAAPPEIGMVLFYLYDSDRQQRIHGIKIFRSDILKRLCAKDVKASEMELLEQMLDLGFRWVIHPETMGRHGAVYSTDSIYGRYQSMYEKDLSTWNVVAPDMQRKAAAFARSGDPIELFALLGSAQGIMGKHVVQDREKDFRTYSTHTLQVLKRVLMQENPQGFEFETGRQPIKFRSEPLNFNDLRWNSDIAGVSAESVLALKEGSISIAESLARDIQIVEQIPLDRLVEQARNNQSNEHFLIWMALSLWHERAYEDAATTLQSALALNDNNWRAQWYLALLLRDSKSMWTIENIELTRDTLRSLLSKHADFDFAATWLQYLGDYKGVPAHESSVRDFFSLNRTEQQRAITLGRQTATSDRLVHSLHDWQLLPAESATHAEYLCVNGDDPDALHALRESNLCQMGIKLISVHFGNEPLVRPNDLLESFSSRYTLWCRLPGALFFRGWGTVRPQSFWDFRTTLPLPQRASELSGA